MQAIHDMYSVLSYLRRHSKYCCLQEESCEVCPFPMDVRCNIDVDALGDDNIDEGKCEISPDGLLYSCNEGETCIDKNVETLCIKGKCLFVPFCVLIC